MIQSGLWKKELLLLLHDYLVSVVVRARLSLLKNKFCLKNYLYVFSFHPWLNFFFRWHRYRYIIICWLSAGLEPSSTISFRQRYLRNPLLTSAHPSLISGVRPFHQKILQSSLFCLPMCPCHLLGSMKDQVSYISLTLTFFLTSSHLGVSVSCWKFLEFFRARNILIILCNSLSLLVLLMHNLFHRPTKTNTVLL